MIQLSELIGKKVISLYNLKFEGTITNILFDSKRQRAKYLILQNEEDFVEKVINLKHVYNISNALCIKNDTCIRLKDEMELELLGYYNPICDEIFDTTGSHFGVLNDILLDDKFNVEYYVSKNSTFDKSNIVCFNAHLLLLKNGKETLAKFSPPKKIETPQSDIVVQIPQEIAIQPVENPLPITKTPNKAIINSNILLDRLITKNITTQNGEIIARQNQRITQNIIKTARMYGKLKELTEYSVKS